MTVLWTEIGHGRRLHLAPNTTTNRHTLCGRTWTTPIAHAWPVIDNRRGQDGRPACWYCLRVASYITKAAA